MKTAIYQKYRGKLTKEDIKDGMEKCFDNASFLLKEAMKQQKNKKYNLSYYFSYTAEEEFIKIYLLLYYFVIVKKEGIKSFWNYFTNHIPKKRLILFKRFVDDKDKNSNKTWLENIYFLINEKAYQTIRENSIYCDVVSPKKFVAPFDNFEPKDASETIRRLRLEKKKWKEGIASADKMDLIIKYMEQNTDDFSSPSEAFRKTHGKFLTDKSQTFKSYSLDKSLQKKKVK